MSFLHTLQLCDNGLGDDGMLVVADVLPRCPLLGTLKLRRTRPGHAGTVALAAALRQLARLRLLDVSGNGLHDADAIELFGALGPYLTQLYVHGSYALAVLRRLSR